MITVIGTPQAAAAGNGNNVTLTFDVAPQQDDVVYVVGGHAKITGSPPIGPSTAGYTQIAFQNTAQPAFGVWRKQMGSSPDSTVICQGSGDVTYGSSYACIVLRGVDATTPEDAAVVGSSGYDQSDITTVTDGAFVLACCGARKDTAMGTLTNYTTFGAQVTDTNRSAVGLGYREIVTAGTETIGTWSGSGVAPAYNFTVAVRPASTGLTAVGKSLDFLWNAAANVGKSLQQIWTTHATINKDLQQIWNVNTKTSKDLQTIWNVNTKIGKDLQQIWNVRAAPSKELQLLWNVLSNASTSPVGKDLELLWNVRALVRKQGPNILTGTYNTTFDADVVGWTAGSGTLAWDNGKLKLTKTGMFPYVEQIADVLHTGSSRIKFKAFASIPMTIYFTVYADDGVSDPSKNFSSGPIDIGTIEKEYSFDFIFTGTKITEIEVGFYNTAPPNGTSLWLDDISVSSQDLTLFWNVRAVRDKDLSLLWNSRKNVAAELFLFWNTQAKVALGKELFIPWNTLTKVTKDIVLRWTVLTKVGQNRVLVWNVAAVIGKDLQITWHVIRVGIWIVPSPASPSVWTDINPDTEVWTPIPPSVPVWS